MLSVLARGRAPLGITFLKFYFAATCNELGSEEDALPDELAQCGELHELWLNDNGLQQFPAAIFGCTKLQHLALDGNALKKIPRLIGNLVSLRRLSVCMNFIEAVPRDIAGCRSLEKLWLRDNQVKKVDPALNACVKLRMLDLSFNRLEHLPTEMVVFDDWRNKEPLAECFVDLTGNPVAGDELDDENGGAAKI